MPSLIEPHRLGNASLDVFFFTIRCRPNKSRVYSSGLTGHCVSSLTQIHRGHAKRRWLPYVLFISRKMENKELQEFIDKSKVECLNEDENFKASNALNQPNTELYLASDDEDPELLLKIGFTQPVKLASIRFFATPDGVADGSAPKRIKLFSNTLSIGFSEAG
eukprot:GHVT01078570.1.p1 GENE.GHVT01078570.1~~GHVT01078570.1.p1  ORF type:complete len:163 (+),score=12.73 GHVT01078570.1:1809-2297(+)